MGRKQTLQKREVPYKQHLENRRILAEKTLIRECDIWVIALNNVLGYGAKRIKEVFRELEPMDVKKEEADDKISNRELVGIVIQKNWDEMERVLRKSGIGEKRMIRILSNISAIYKEYADDLNGVDWVYADTKIARAVKRIMGG